MKLGNVVSQGAVLAALLLCLGRASADKLPQPLASDLTYDFPAHRVAVSYADGLGIRSFKLSGQETDFPHLQYPVGDWEWFSLEVPPASSSGVHAELSAKLISVPWQSPDVHHGDKSFMLVFRRKDVVRAGIDLAVRMEVALEEPRVDISYVVHNGSGGTLTDPYMMVGLPGFLRHLWVSAVETGADERREAVPADSAFAWEAIRSGLSEVTLLQDEVRPADGDLRPLQGVAEIVEGGTTYRLTSTYLPDANVRRARSAHTNKPAYLTSHLYVYLDHIGAGESRTITVTHELSRLDGQHTRAPRGSCGMIKGSR